ncbi:MAG: hypothetical protein RL240_3574 [Planctomycetota bacterium]|jgi:hypothetical protein
MGMPGYIDIEITTAFDAEKGLVTRSVRFVDGWGLNSLVVSELGEQKWWHLNRAIVADTIELPDGQHKVDRQHIGPGQFDYKWMPTKATDD